jgi:hypothetical protein
MKKTFLALMLVLTFIFISCNNDDMETEVNPFIGTWENDTGTWVFTETNITVYYIDGDVYWSGTYTYDDTNLTYYWDYRSPQVEEYDWPNPQIYPYTIENDTLTIAIIQLTKVSK